MEHRLSGYVPPENARIARALWAACVWDRALLEHAIRWGSDLELAWRENDRLEIALPLAMLRGVSLDRIASTARAWLLAALDDLGKPVLGWPEDDRTLLYRCGNEACAPDVDVATLDALIAQCTKRCTAKAPGLYRASLLSAAASVACLGGRRVGWGVGAAACGELLAVELLDAFDEAAEARDLFAPRADRGAFLRRAFELARALDQEGSVA
jgi:hypothetical protein